MPVLKIRKSVKIWCSNSKISIFASPGKFSNMENIHTMAKKYPYGYEKKFPKIFDFRDMPCHKYFEWLVPCLLKIIKNTYTHFRDRVTRDWWCTEDLLVRPSRIAKAAKWFCTAYARVGPFSSSINCNNTQ